MPAPWSLLNLPSSLDYVLPWVLLPTGQYFLLYSIAWPFEKFWVVCTGPSFPVSTMSLCPLGCAVLFTCITRSSPSWGVLYSTCGIKRFWQIFSLAGLASCHFYVWRRYLYEGSCKSVPHTQIAHHLFRKVSLENKSDTVTVLSIVNLEESCHETYAHLKHKCILFAWAVTISLLSYIQVTKNVSSVFHYLFFVQLVK